MYILLFVILFSGISEALGISIIIPLLSLEEGPNSDNKYAQAVYGFLLELGLEPSLTNILGLMVALFICKALLMTAQTVIASRISTGLLRDLRNSFCLKYTKAKYDYFISKPIGYFNNIISTESNMAISGLNNFIRVFVSMAFIGTYCLGAALINFWLTISALVLSGVLFFALRSLARYNQRLSINISRTNAEIQSLIIQKLHNYKYLKATSSFAPILKKIRRTVKENMEYTFKNVVCLETPQHAMEPLVITAICVLIWYFVGIQHRQFAEVAVFIIFFHRALLKILSFQNAWQRFSSHVGGILVVESASKELAAHKEPEGRVGVERLEQGIEIKDVNFFYDEKQTLHGVNLHIPKNKSIGIVGPSGAGKTTLFDLLTGLLRPASGEVTWDGVNYRDIQLDSLRRLCGYVTQEPVTFDDTIANNIAFWNCDPDTEPCAERIRRAAELAGCSGFIDECEQGLLTRLGEKGVKLSGGQRQRISIAREIFKQPQLLIFDEATSSLDTESEKMIQESIATLKGSCTMVLIAHRLSTIRDCDMIYVVDKGRVVQQGSFTELAAQKGSLFDTMRQAQRL